MVEDIKPLSAQTQKELGGDNLMFVVAFDTAGSRTLFRAPKVNASEVTFQEPERSAGVSRISAMSVVTLTPNSPDCCIINIDGKLTKFCW